MSVPTASSSPSASGRFVVVDDEDSVRFVLRRMVERLGYEVAIAANGAELRAIVDSSPNPYDGMFIDIRLGVESGLELAAEVKRRFPGTGIVGMGGALDVDAKQAIDDGVLTALLAKPFAFADLKSVLATLAEQGRTTGMNSRSDSCR